MYLSNFFYLILIIAYSILFSGCSRIIDWGVKTFNQGCPIETCFDVPRAYLRNARVYDQFTTLGIFTGLWLSQEVIKCYVDTHAKKFSLTPEQTKELFEQEMLEKDQKLISFYVLAYSPEESNNPLYIPDKNEDAPWAVTLRINDKTYKPFKIKVVQLTTIYELIFGKYFTRFKVAYLVQFLAKDPDDNPLIRPDVESIVLCFNSLNNRAALIWEIDASGNLLQKRVKGCYCPDDENYDCEACC